MGKKSRAKKGCRRDPAPALRGPSAAKRLLEELQSASPPTWGARDIASAADDVAGRIGLEASVLRGILAENREDLAQIALGRLRDRLPPEIADLIPRVAEAAIGVLGTRQANASATTIEDGDWLIVMNEGLPFLFHETARALSLLVAYTDGSLPPPETDPKLAPKFIAEVVRQLGGFGSFGGWDYPAEPGRLVFANDLAMNAEMAVIAHEASHILLGHPSVPTTPEPERRHMELDADTLSWALLAHASLEARDAERFRLDFSAADFALRTLRMLRRVQNQGRDSATATHPSFTHRLERLHKWARAFCADDATFGALMAIPDTFEKVFADVVASLEAE